MKTANSTLPNIYTSDCETDPFKWNREPRPFCWGLFLGDEYIETWGSNCTQKMREKLTNVPPGVIYIHNGGKFDLYYCMDWLSQDDDIMFINGRIVRAYIKCNGGKHEVRDSLAIMPFPLAKYKKDEVDYRIFEKNKRILPQNKRTIRRYLKNDCVYLWELCTDFWNKFGNNLTVGGTAMKEIKKRHTFECLNEIDDGYIRSSYYYGGRVQCFQKGIIERPERHAFKVYDINQSYPNAMRNFLHPISAPKLDNTISKDTYFIGARGYSRGCFPRRTDVGIHFTEGFGDFYVSIHEYQAAIELGLFEPEEILETVNFDQAGSFDVFVDDFHVLRNDAKERKDESGSLVYKYVGNSGYGKFGQDPDNYYDYKLSGINEDLSRFGYTRESLIEFTNYILWKIPSTSSGRYNVATGASVTGAARSVLMRGLSGAVTPLYCDTDSIICETLSGVPISETDLGAWKIEAKFNRAAIAGKKLYALYDNKRCVKQASKGGKLTPKEIFKVAQGKEVIFKKTAPCFRFDGHAPRFIARRFNMT